MDSNTSTGVVKTRKGKSLRINAFGEAGQVHVRIGRLSSQQQVFSNAEIQPYKAS